MINSKKILTILIIIGLAFALIVTIKMAGQSQDIRKKAAGSTANLVLSPNTEVFKNGETKSFDIQARFSGGSASEKIGYLQAEITFDKNLLNVTPNDSTTSYLDSSTSGLGQVVQISTGSEANTNGKIIIKLGAESKTTGPDTSNFITMAKINFIAVGPDVTDKDISITYSEIVYNIDPPSDMTVNNAGAKYSISGTLTTPTLTPTTPPNATNTPGAPTNTPIPPTGTLTPTPRIGDPDPTNTPIPPTNTPPANNPTPTSSVPTPTPTMYQVTIPPTPPSDRDKYLIDIGNKQSLTIQIGPGNGSGVQIKFKAKLANVQGHPDVYLRLRAKDELAFLNNPQDEVANNDSCNNPPSSVREYLIPVKADADGIYAPSANASPYAYVQKKGNGKTKTAQTSNVTISSDGWVTLDGLYTDRYYSLFLKGPKTRSTREIEHVIWSGGSQSLPEFDWTSDDLALQPGDLQDPNNNYVQNCTVNSIDLSLIEERLGNTDPDALRVADVNYDGVVNGNDISKVVNTLSTKPDDDH